MLPGHLAIAYLLDHYLDFESGPLYAARIFPDVSENLLRALRVAPAGRGAAHSLAGVAISTLVVTLGRGRPAGRSWLAGYLGHLLGDVDGTIPWFYPFVGYHYRIRNLTLPQSLLRGLTRPSLAEIALILWALLLARARLRRPPR
jgi:hypothetical protein